MFLRVDETKKIIFECKISRTLSEKEKNLKKEGDTKKLCIHYRLELLMRTSPLKSDRQFSIGPSHHGDSGVLSDSAGLIRFLLLLLLFEEGACGLVVVGAEQPLRLIKLPFRLEAACEPLWLRILPFTPMLTLLLLAFDMEVEVDELSKLKFR